MYPSYNVKQHVQSLLVSGLLQDFSIDYINQFNFSLQGFGKEVG